MFGYFLSFSSCVFHRCVRLLAPRRKVCVFCVLFCLSTNQSVWELIQLMALLGLSFLMCFFGMLYRLFVMLKRFPIESKSRSKKLYEVVIVLVHLCLSSIELWTFLPCLHLNSLFFIDRSLKLRNRIRLQVGSVTAICFTCFLIRCIVVSSRI